MLDPLGCSARAAGAGDIDACAYAAVKRQNPLGPIGTTVSLYVMHKMGKINRSRGFGR